MAAIQSLTFKDSRGEARRIDFLAPESSQSRRDFQTTIITGHNGSHKSTLLRELVAALTLSDSESRATLNYESEGPHHVLCASGSVADRFPAKELPGGAHSRFDVPSYSYLGQRVGPNILSKKAPVETMLSFALDPARAERFTSHFFQQAHRLAGIRPSVDFVFERRHARFEKGDRDLLGRVQSKTPESDVARPRRSSQGGSNAPYISYATARWLLDEFTYDEFTALEYLLSRQGRRLKATLTPFGAVCDELSPNVLRLGLLTGLVGLVEATAQPAQAKGSFSLFELSSGEYHMYSTILGLGFGMSESSIVLIDEPENSLHPQWQREFMDAVFDISAETLRDGHLVVCTHSPLIVATALEGSSVVDLTEDESQPSTVNFGASADELLLSQFGVGSSRNRIVVDTVQRAVSLVERGDFGSEVFKSLVPELQRIVESLSPGDPLTEVIYALLEEEDVE